jgi:recombination protein RecA
MIEKAGAWYSYNEERIGQGKDNVRAFLKQHPEMAEDIDRRLRDVLLPKETDADEIGSDEIDSEAIDNKASNNKASNNTSSNTGPKVNPKMVEIS